jgi:excisionase family DNA binding protein
LSQPERFLLTVSEVAEATGLSSNAVYRAIAAGELRASKLRRRLRVQAADLEAWIDANVVCARGVDGPPPPTLRPGRRGHGLRELCSRSMPDSPVRRADCPHAVSHSERR